MAWGFNKRTLITVIVVIIVIIILWSLGKSSVQRVREWFREKLPQWVRGLSRPFTLEDPLAWLEGFPLERTGALPLERIITPPSVIPRGREITSQSLLSKEREKPTPEQFRGEKKRERYTRALLEYYFSRPFPSVRPHWLRNPHTNKSLEIDCYNEDLSLAVEVSGEQHYTQSSTFHGNRDQFLAQVYRDQVKKEQILKRGLDFLVVPYTVPTEAIASYLEEKLHLPEKI